MGVLMYKDRYIYWGQGGARGERAAATPQTTVTRVYTDDYRLQLYTMKAPVARAPGP